MVQVSSFTFSGSAATAATIMSATTDEKVTINGITVSFAGVGGVRFYQNTAVAASQILDITSDTAGQTVVKNYTDPLRFARGQPLKAIGYSAAGKLIVTVDGYLDDRTFWEN